MKVDDRKCAGCGNCVSVCTMGAISIRDGKSYVEQDACVECGTCRRFLVSEDLSPGLVRLVRALLKRARMIYDAPPDICPTGALYQPEIEWPRSVRQVFSDPGAVHEATGVGGRGTEEVKTNDVTGRIGPGEAGLVIELGRPGIGSRFHDVQTMAVALAGAGAIFEPGNPVTHLMTDPSKGSIRPDILDEKVMSAILEIKCDLDRVPALLEAVHRTGREIATVCAVAISGKCGPDGEIPYADMVPAGKFTMSLQAKTNLGLGRPCTERAENR